MVVRVCRHYSTKMSGRRDKENEKSNKQFWYSNQWKRIVNQQCDNFNPKRPNQVRSQEMKPESRAKSSPEGSPPTAEKEVRRENMAVECVVLNDGYICLEVNPAFLESSSSLVCLVDIYCSLNLRRLGLIRSSGNYFELIKDEERIGERVVNYLLQSALTDKNSLVRLEQFMSNLLHVVENVATGSILEEARKFLKTILELINDTRNAAKNDYLSENFNIALAKENDRRDAAIFSQLKHLFNNDRLMMFGSALGKKIGSVVDEEKPTPAVFSAAGTSSGESVGHFRSMLLKMLKRGPQEMLESFQSEATEHSGGGGKRIRLSKITRVMRARMRSKTEKERVEWEKSSDDEYK